MGQKVNPTAYRLGNLFEWSSRWFNQRKYKKFLKQDYEIRQLIKKELQEAGLEKIKIERSPNEARIIIKTSRPGIVIGRGGENIEALKKKINKISQIKAKIEVEEINQPDLNAKLIASDIASQLERRIPFRRAMSQIIERVNEKKEVQGIKISVSGRLNGAEMSRTEWEARGKIPLQTIRADIDFARVNAHTKYGVIGVKVWLYKGEKFN